MSEKSGLGFYEYTENENQKKIELYRQAILIRKDLHTMINQHTHTPVSMNLAVDNLWTALSAFVPYQIAHGHELSEKADRIESIMAGSVADK